MSSEISRPQPVASAAFSASALLPLRAASSSPRVFGKGRLPVSPFWLTCLKQPLAVVHAGSEKGFGVGAEVGFRRRVVVGVDDRDRLGGWRAGGERVGRVQVLGAQSEVARRGGGGVGWGTACSPSGCRWARAAAERATRTEDMQLASPGSGAWQTRLVSYSPRGRGEALVASAAAAAWRHRPPRAEQRRRMRARGRVDVRRRSHAGCRIGESARSGVWSAARPPHLSEIAP